MQAEWFNFLSQILATVLGGGLVILANHLTHRNELRVEDQRQSDRNAALMTGLFIIKNFVVDELNRFEGSQSAGTDTAAFKTALTNLERIIEKSPPETQYVMATVFELSLRLGDFISGLESPFVGQVEVRRRLELLYQALEAFDIFSGKDLTIMSEDEMADMVANPEALTGTEETKS